MTAFAYSDWRAARDEQDEELGPGEETSGRLFGELHGLVDVQGTVDDVS